MEELSESQLKVYEAVNTITNALNGMRDDQVRDAVIAALIHEHRTLQASFWRMIKGVAEQYKYFDHDLRNEDAVKFAKKISEIEQGIRFI